MVARFERSSYAVALMLEQRGTTLLDRYGLNAKDDAAAGGAVPICVATVDMIGAAGVSGLTPAEDHALVCQALAALQAEQGS